MVGISYFPYLRGRQSELLALRDLMVAGKLSPYVIPIIEPVKDTSTVRNVLAEFQRSDHAVIIVLNPEHGEFVTENYAGRVQESLRLCELNQVTPMVLMNSKTYYDALSAAKNGEWQTNPLSLATIIPQDYEIDSKGIIPGLNELAPKLVFYTDIEAREDAITSLENASSDIVRFAQIADRFNRRERNVDYAEKPDEMFSRDYGKCEMRGDIGFSDYSVVGDHFSEGGFAPYAVAIHIVYFNEDQSMLRIKHYVSDTNADYRDVPIKFNEAVEKLVPDVKKGLIEETEGIRHFMQQASSGTFPGLATVKRWSIMHHLELIGHYLDGQDARKVA